MKNKHETNNSIPMEKKPKKFPLPNFMIFGVLLLCCFSDEVGSTNNTTTPLSNNNITNSNNLNTTTNFNTTTNDNTTNNNVTSPSTNVTNPNMTSSNLTTAQTLNTTVGTTTTTPAPPPPWRPAIAMETAEFYGTDFSQLRVTFNDTLNRTVDYNNCSQIFDANTTLLMYLGRTAICRQLSDNSILVTPATYAVVRNGYLLKANKSNFAPRLVSVKPAIMPVPALVISGFTEMCGACNSTSGNESISFNLDKSTGLGYGTLREIAWNITWADFLPLPPVSTQPPVVAVSSSPPVTMSSTEVERLAMTSTAAATSYIQSIPFSMTSSSVAMASNGNGSLGNESNSSVSSMDVHASSTLDTPASSLMEMAGSSSAIDTTDFVSSAATLILDDGYASSSAAPPPSNIDLAPSSVDNADAVMSSSILITTTTLMPPTSRMVPSFNYTPYLNAHQNSPVINLPLSIFNRSNVYQLHVRAKNAFGIEATTVMNISFDFACGAVAKLQRVAHAQILYEVTVRYPPCFGGDQSRTYEWSHSSHSITVEGRSHIKTTVNQYLIKRNDLTPGQQYTVKVQINASSLSSSSYDGGVITESANFTHNARPLQCQILGKQISVGWNETMVLDGRSSTDPDATQNEATRMVWSCENQDDGNFCTDSNNVALSASGDTLELFVGAQTFPKVLANGTFPSQSISFRFKLTFTKGARSSTDEVVVKLLPYGTPQLVVYTKTSRMSRASPVSFVAELFGELSGTYDYQWKCYDKIDIDQKNLIPIYVTRTGSRSIQNGVTKRHLALSVLRIPGNVFHHEFDMLCQCTCKGSVASDNVKFTRLFTPSLLSEPSEGEAFATDFYFRVVDVRTGFNDALLAYRFGYYPDGGDSPGISPIQWLTGWTGSNSLENVRLPLSVDKTAANIKIFAQIRSDDQTLDQISRVISLKRPAVGSENADNAKLLQTLSRLTKEFLVYDLFKGASFLNAQLVLYTNLNHLVIGKKRKRKRRALPETDLQYDIIQLIDVTTASPYEPETIDQALRTINQLVVKSNGRIHLDMVKKIRDFLVYVSTHEDFFTLEGDIDYGSQFDTVLQSLGALVSSSSSSQVTSVIRPSLGDITRKYVLKMLYERDSPFLNQTSWSSNQISVTYTSYHFVEAPVTILKMGTWFKERYSLWDCTNGNHPQNCSGFYISQVKYEGTLYNDQLYDRYTGGPITDIYQVDAWYLDPALDRYERLDFGNETLFEVHFPRNDQTAVKGDDIQCLLWEESIKAFNESACVTNKMIASDKVICQCNRVGLMTARKTPPLIAPTTESPSPGANLTYQMFFYADDDRCALPKYDFFRPKFKTQLCELLGISMKRMKITGCTAAAVIGITMHFYIIDVVGERRNINIQAHMQDIMEKESFIVQMNQGGNVFMFDIDQTTPKPPPPPIPPIGAVTVDWLPIFIAIGALAALFLFIIIFVYCYHVKALRDKKFTKVNSDKKKISTEEEEEEEEDERDGNGKKKKSKKQLSREIKSIVDEDLAFEEEASVAPSNNQRRVSLMPPKSRKKSAIAPVLDANSVAMGTSGMTSTATGYLSFQARQQATLEPPRIMLDEDEGDEGDDGDANNDNKDEAPKPPSKNLKKKSRTVSLALTAIRRTKDTSTPLESFVENDDGGDGDGSPALEMRQEDQNAPDYTEDSQQQSSV